MDRDECSGHVPQAFCCAITQEEMRDPVMAGDGHCYERVAIVEWFRRAARRQVPPTSPNTGAELTSTELVPNHSLRQAIEEWREQQFMALDPARLEVSAQRLGSGSFGDVFAGTLRNGRAVARIEVAVKQLPAMDAQREKQALQKELKVHRRAALRCSGVCVLYGICELEGQRLGLVMKRYKCSLDACIREAIAGGSPLDEERVSTWSIKLFNTLRQLHAPECGVVVRDIKPPNILLDAYDEPVLADFGIAEIVRTMSRVPQTSMKGTLNYMAPEAFDEGSVGPPVDVWAMVCVVLELHTLKMPWGGMQMQQIIKAVCVEKRVPDVPDSAPAAAFLRRCFAFAPGQRPTSAEVAKALADDPASKGTLARRQRAAKEQAAKLSELQERARLASAQGGEGMAALQKTSTADRQDVQVDHKLSLTLRQYDLQHVEADLVRNRFHTVRRVADMDPDDVLALALPRGDAKAFQKMLLKLQSALQNEHEKLARVEDDLAAKSSPSPTRARHEDQDDEAGKDLILPSEAEWTKPEVTSYEQDTMQERHVQEGPTDSVQDADLLLELFSTDKHDIIEQTKRDASGRTTVKRWRKGSLLGKGAFAKCYRVTDLAVNTDWACKILQKSSLTKQRHVQKLQSEIKIHRSIFHKNVVRFEDVFEDEESVYIIMEFCPNQTMLDLVKREKRLTEADTRRYMLQTLDAVRHMHHRNVIHRDLQLGNLFLGKNNEIKIGDFGLACKLAFDGERKKTLCGTPNYIAPEVLDGENGHSFEVDVWSIGVVLYACLVGKAPFETADIKSTYKLIRANQYSFPDRLELSDGAKKLVRRILQSRPEARPTIEAILQDEWFLGQGLALLQVRDEVARVRQPETCASVTCPHACISHSQCPRYSPTTTRAGRSKPLPACTHSCGFA